MSKAEETLARLQYIEEHTAALEKMWAMFISDTIPNKRQWAVWLNKHDYEEITSAIEITGTWINREAPDGSMPEERKIKYLSGVLNGTKFNKMTGEEREQYIHDVRSRAGRLGALKGWQNRKKQALLGSAGLAGVCCDLPSVSWCLSCSCSHCFSCSGSASCSRSSGRVGTEAAAPLPPKSVETKQEQKQNTTKPKPEPTPPPAARASGTNGKTKTAPDGTPYPPSFERWTNARRLEWLEFHDGKGTVTKGFVPPTPTKYKFQTFEDEP
jgi:hypothetical protein